MVSCRNLHFPFLNRGALDSTNPKLVKTQAFKVTLNFSLAPLWGRGGHSGAKTEIIFQFLEKKTHAPLPLPTHAPLHSMDPLYHCATRVYIYFSCFRQYCFTFPGGCGKTGRLVKSRLLWWTWIWASYQRLKNDQKRSCCWTTSTQI